VTAARPEAPWVLGALALGLAVALVAGFQLARASMAAEAAAPVDRLAVADAHFARDELADALAGYLEVLAVQPDHPLALARAGWIAFEGGDGATAERLLAAALEHQPAHPEAHWYLLQVRLAAGDAAGAEAVRRALLDRDDLSDDFRAEVEALTAP
jgi:tetratricopeptide (TPR) repeat protein